MIRTQNIVHLASKRKALVRHKDIFNVVIMCRDATTEFGLNQKDSKKEKENFANWRKKRNFAPLLA